MTSGTLIVRASADAWSGIITNELTGTGSNFMNEQFNIAPNFIVQDVVKSSAFYRDKLGFVFDNYWGDPPDFVIVQGLGSSIFLKSLAGVDSSFPNHKVHEDLGWDAYICVPDVEAVYQDFKRRGAQIYREVEDAPYGLRDFEVQDLDGYILCIGQYIKNG
jgi:catechol 2,3-dioxygenase-like lactoylglutathione lyase family enzyme